MNARPPGDDTTRPRPAEELTETELAVLALEKRWWKYAAAKETTVRETFGWSMTRYYQVLDALIDKPAALAVDPVTVNRLRRLRDARRRARTGEGT